MNGEQQSLIPGPMPKCHRCFVELARTVDVSFRECLACNHAVAEEFLLDAVRREWRRTTDERRRSICEAWAAKVRGDEEKVREIVGYARERGWIS